MSAPRICAFYSRGPHYVRLLRCLRENYPDATLVAAIPTSFPYHAIEGLVDETLRLDDGTKPKRLAQNWTTLGQIRRAKCSHLVIMFDSPRLNLLSALSGASVRRCFTVDGRFYKLKQPLITVFLNYLRQRMTGMWYYARAGWGTRKSQ